MHKEGDRIVETPVEARAGFLDRPVFVVLGVSIALAVAGMALAYAGLIEPDMQISRIRLSDKNFTPSPTTRRAQARSGVRARSALFGTA